MSMHASDYSGGLGTGVGLGTLGFGALREPPLSPPTAQAPHAGPTASVHANGNGTGLIQPTTGEPLHGLLGGTAIVAQDTVATTAPTEATPAETPSLPFVDLRAFAIDRSAARLIPEQVANLHTALPIGFEQGLPLVAIADAGDSAMQAVRAALGCDARFALASRTDLVASIAAAYTAPAAGAIRLATPAAEPARLVDLTPPADETMPTVAPIAPVHDFGLITVTPIETAEQAPLELLPVVSAQTVEETPVVPVTIAPLVPIATVETPVEQPAAMVGPTTVTAEPVAETAIETAEPSIVTTAPVAETTIETAATPTHEATPTPETTPAVVTSIVEATPSLQPTPTLESAPEIKPTLEAIPALEATPSLETTPELGTTPALETTETDEPTTPTTRFRVVVRLSGAEPVEVGAFDGVGEAKDRAIEIVEQLTSEDGSWPYFRGRFLRPDAIVSVDVVEETAW